MNIAAIVAGGTGTRLGGNMPKQFLYLNKKPVLCYSLSVFLSHPAIDYVIVGTHKDYVTLAESYKKDYFENTERLLITTGGQDRNDTLMNILAAAETHCQAPKDSVILSHDAARPFVTSKMIDDALREIVHYNAVCTAIPAVDTTVIAPNGQLEAFPSRADLLRLQTPQTFRLDEFQNIYTSLTTEERRTATDIGRLYYLCGKSVKFTDGSESNIKITYPQDLAIAQAIINSQLLGEANKKIPANHELRI